jgi:hypothetical protein
VSNIIQLTNQLAHTARTLGAHSGSDACQSLVAWIDALRSIYQDELVEVQPEGLQALQAQVRQLDALRALARGEVQTNGRI